ncbi:DUF167 domain-containing protein [Sphingopyxis yananensis]|uniref:DUF167 domain-containing protein n=1 Tax=Sphingopyxis yananensis TaxID=2886687 RepID=UPI001D0F5FAA|nr:DUF167 domain-containing protein [Sphingopyxis yananensis]MCC2602802.1 DUF167 domain-containing protein [Sphingopyxis yananensis]
MKYRPAPELTTALLAIARDTRRMEVRVTPGAGRDEVKLVDGAVHVRVTAPPADGAANEAVIKLLAAALGRPKRDISLLRGDTARIKLIGIAAP